MKLRSSWSAVASTMRLIRGRGKLSFRHARLTSVKLMQSHHLSFAFLTSTTLANHSRYSTSLIASAWRSLPTSSFIAFSLSGAKLLFCFTGLKDGLTFSLCVTPPLPPGRMMGAQNYVELGLFNLFFYQWWAQTFIIL